MRVVSGGAGRARPTLCRAHPEVKTDDGVEGAFQGRDRRPSSVAVAPAYGRAVDLHDAVATAVVDHAMATQGSVRTFLARNALVRQRTLLACVAGDTDEDGRAYPLHNVPLRGGERR